jgi:acyl-CoA dehydrogenase
VAGFVPREVLRQMGEFGFFSLRVPEALGGAGLDARASVVLAEEVGRSTHGGFAITVLVHTDMASPHLIRFGNKRQLEKYLPGIMAGTTITAVGVTEPGAGSDVAGIRTRAVRDGNHYVLNGAKMFITNGVHGDLYFIAARTDAEAKGSRAITIFMVEKGTPGFRVGRALDKTGWRSSDTAELFFEDCRVPAESVLGEANRGFYSIMANFQTERLVIGAMAMAEAREAIRLTFDYVNQRTAFGAPLWEKQAIRQRLSRRLAEVEAARQLVHHTAWLDAEGRDCVAQVSMVKALAGDLVNDVLYDCVQFHGGMGFMRETAVERMARDARVQSIGGGASEVMLEEIAKRFGQVLSE